MKNDPGSNFEMGAHYAAASVDASTVYGTAIDHAKGDSASFIINCGTWATSFVATLQHSTDGSSDWTDEVAGAGNTLTATLTEAGAAKVHVPNPRSRYSRLKFVLGGTCVFSCDYVLGPKLDNLPGVTT